MPLHIESTVNPWQGIIFVRNPDSPYFSGVFRFEIQFASFNQIRQYLQPSTIPTSRPYSYTWYPIISLQSEIHTKDDSEKRIAQYCLHGIEPAEQDAISIDKPFSRTLYVLKRLTDWFNGVNLDHDEQLAITDVKVSKSDTLLYETPRYNERLITFTSVSTPDDGDISEMARQLVLDTSTMG